MLFKERMQTLSEEAVATQPTTPGIVPSVQPTLQPSGSVPNTTTPTSNHLPHATETQPNEFTCVMQTSAVFVPVMPHHVTANLDTGQPLGTSSANQVNADLSTLISNCATAIKYAAKTVLPKQEVNNVVKRSVSATSRRLYE